jgi:hypothetical protein
MRKTIQLLAVITISAFITTSCGGGDMSSASPKEVLITFFERLSKKDIAGARQLATKESETVLNTMETAFEKFKDMAEKQEDMAEDFKHVEFGEAKITGDVAMVPVKDTKKNEEFEMPLKKEDGSWKVDFSPASILRMAREKGDGNEDLENMDPATMERNMRMADSAMKNLDPETMKKAMEMADSALKNMTPEQREQMKDLMEQFKEKK